MTEVAPTAWFDGRLMPVGEVRVSPLAHSLHYGTGVFEGIRAYEQASGGGGVFRLREHMQRLEDSARILGYELPFDVERTSAAALEVMRANGMAHGYLRPLAWLGEGDMGVAGGDNPVHVLIVAWPWGAYLGEEGLRNGIRTTITGYERATGNAVANRAKVTGHYVGTFMAKRQVQAAGFAEGLLLDRDGYLAEGTGENLFLVHGGRLITPPADASILLGLTRDTLLTLAADLGIEVSQRRVGRSDLYIADEAFLCGTAAEVTPIREVDGRQLRESPGPVTKLLQSTYMDLVRGLGERAPDWITSI